MSEPAFPPLTYTDDEIVSYIPSGWNLVPGSARWDEGEDAFTFQVLDGSDLEWDVAVPQKDVGQRGRVLALRHAVDELERKRFKSFL